MTKKEGEELLSAGIVLVLGLTLGYLVGAAFPPFTRGPDKPATKTDPAPPPATGDSTT